MGGLVLDVFIAYLLRVLMRMWRETRSSAWNLIEAEIATISAPSAWGCPLVEVVYLYKHNDVEYSGLENLPFVSENSVARYFRDHPQGSMILVRVNALNPEVSVLRTADQERLASRGY
jgi:hypothetical protein